MDQKINKQLLEEILEIKKALAQVVTKKDAKDFLTKDDLKNFATKDDLKAELSKYATKDDLKQFATKDDLKNVKDELLEKLTELDKMQMAIFKTVESTKEDRIVVEKLTKRVDRLEEKVFV